MYGGASGSSSGGAAENYGSMFGGGGGSAAQPPASYESYGNYDRRVRELSQKKNYIQLICL